jgi:hypothetical protein
VVLVTRVAALADRIHLRDGRIERTSKSAAFLRQLGRDGRARNRQPSRPLSPWRRRCHGGRRFSAALRDGLRSEARRLLAADLRVEGLRPLPPEAEAILAARADLRRTRVREMPTVVVAAAGSARSGRSRLVELRAIDGDYPFYGKLDVEPDRPLAELLAEDGAVAGPELLEKLGLAQAITGRQALSRGVVRSN